MNKQYYVSACLIFKNEAKYLKEWIEYHLIVGFDHFYLYNNFSEDNYKEVLKPYIDKDLVTLIDWPEKPGQMSAYKHCLKTYSSQSDWIAFIDTDEFALPIKHNNLKNWLKKYEKFPCVMGFWRNFSSGGIIAENPNIPIIEQFTSCMGYASPKSFINTHYTKNITSFNIAHYARYKFFNKICPENAAFFCGLSKTIKTPEFQFNHYYCKSYEYYKNKKIPGGSVHKCNDKYDFSKFYEIDQQGIYKDYTIYKYLTKLKTFDLDTYHSN